MGAKKIRTNGFTLLELIIVLFLVSLILGLSSVFFANTLRSSKLDATVRELSSSIRHARSLAMVSGERKAFTIDIDSRKYGMEGRNEKDIPSDINIKIISSSSEEITSGKYQLMLNRNGGTEGGTIVLWNNKKTLRIEIDPIIGAVVAK